MKTIIKEIQCGTIAKMTFWTDKYNPDIKNLIDKISEEKPNASHEEIDKMEFEYKYKLQNIEIFKHPSSKNDIYKLSAHAIKEINDVVTSVESEVLKMKFGQWDW